MNTLFGTISIVIKTFFESGQIREDKPVEGSGSLVIEQVNKTSAMFI